MGFLMNKQVFWKLDKSHRRLYGENGIEIHFTKYEFNLFFYLLSQQQQVCSSSSIIEQVWGDSPKGSYAADSSNLIQLISKIRRQLKPLEKIMEIKSQRGVGYFLSMSEGYVFNDDEISYTPQTIYDRDSETEKKYRFYQSQFLKQLFSLNQDRQFRIRDFGFVLLLSVFFGGILLLRQTSRLPTSPVYKANSGLHVGDCGIPSELIFTQENLACSDISDFNFAQDHSYIISKAAGNIYVSSF
ncbi:hypothetical protein BS333_01000 [Vibrio azureus]|nr:hypothetical protein BS333_01000 [Vibrio azureus]